MAAPIGDLVPLYRPAFTMMKELDGNQSTASSPLTAALPAPPPAQRWQWLPDDLSGTYFGCQRVGLGRNTLNVTHCFTCHFTNFGVPSQAKCVHNVTLLHTLWFPKPHILWCQPDAPGLSSAALCSVFGDQSECHKRLQKPPSSSALQPAYCCPKRSERACTCRAMIFTSGFLS